MLLCHVVMRHFEYYLYRKVERTVTTPPMFLMRLQFFLVALLALAFVGHGTALRFAQIAPLLLWSLFRARHELRELLKNVRWLDRNQAPPVP